MAAMAAATAAGEITADTVATAEARAGTAPEAEREAAIVEETGVVTAASVAARPSPSSTPPSPT